MPAQGSQTNSLLQKDEALRQSEERFRRVVEFAPNAMVMIAPSGTIEMVNREAERLFGYDRAELLGKPVEVLVPDRFRDMHQGLRDLFFKLPAARPMGPGRELFGRKKDGREFPLEIGLNPIETNDGTFVLSAIVDISERRRRETEAGHLAAIVNSSGDPIISKNLMGVVTSWNAAAERLFGYRANEIVGSNIARLIPPERLDEEAMILRHIKNGERIEHMETVRRRKDGSDVAVSLTVSPIFDRTGTIVGASKILHDISDRLRAADRLRLSEERFRSIFNAVAEGIFISDAETGAFVDVNGPGAAMYGYTPEEMLGHDIGLISSGESPYDMKGAFAWITRAAATGEVQQFDWHGKRKDGALIWVEVSIRFAFISGRKVILSIARDVSDRRAMEAQLRQAMKMEAIGTLAGGVAHELNNLLQPIIMMTEIVMADMPPARKEFRQLATVLDAGLKATDIVQRILAFGRVDEASHALLDLALVLKEGIAFIRTIMPSSITVKSEIGDGEVRVRGDKTQLTQILINLATNARDAIGDGVGTLSISLRSVVLDADFAERSTTLAAGTRCAVLEVADSGCGMDAETMQRVFEPFFTTKPVGKGTGLGMSVTHGIVTGHGGVVRVDSAPGRGTRFSIYLPLEESVETLTDLPATEAR